MTGVPSSNKLATLITTLIVTLAFLRVLTWFLTPLLPVLIVLGALFAVYRWLFRQRYF